MTDHNTDVSRQDAVEMDAEALAMLARFTPARINTIERVCFGTEWETADLDECRALIADMRAALLFARKTYANLTSDQFARGEDKPAREAIDAALKAPGVQID